MIPTTAMRCEVPGCDHTETAPLHPLPETQTAEAMEAWFQDVTRAATSLTARLVEHGRSHFMDTPIIPGRMFAPGAPAANVRLAPDCQMALTIDDDGHLSLVTQPHLDLATATAILRDVVETIEGEDGAEMLGVRVL